ncbi:MAG: hypothetical protein RMJ00_04115 [Nitrososphaerota archaeon]|nr:hypothetical protein [Candidatus Bathyarchaeota archaeon]MCX8162480.1 hypothetical protein [Candidatus Bathyarchaeota archaeon]MDW8061864.1 hypothetical protein [Nitrososphaerota archaeon]
MPILGGFAKKLTPPKIRITLKLGKDYYTLGESVEGELQLSSDEDVDVDEVRCELLCVESVKTVKYVGARVPARSGRIEPSVTVPTETWESAILHSAKVVLSGPMRIARGFTESYRFRIGIPITLKPTYKGVDRRVTWTVRGVAAVKGRPDAKSDTVELQIVQPAAPPTVREREVVREIVVAPCKYCGTLFPVTEVTCPNCGAKRTG